jgi:hypothetical protein
MAKTKLKEIALKMRRNGHGIKEIARDLTVSSSTASYWCRDISLSPYQMKQLANRAGRKSAIGLLEYSERLRGMRMERVKKSQRIGRSFIQSLTERDIHMIGFGLYWGEGYKRGSEEFGFTNSDQDMIIFYLSWLKSRFAVQKHDLILRVSINDSHVHRDNEVKKYWSKLLDVPLSQFTKTGFIKTQARKIYGSNRKYYGTLRVKVRSGTDYRRQTLGAIEEIKRSTTQ